MLDPSSRWRLELERESTVAIRSVCIRASARASCTLTICWKVSGGISDSIWWRSLPSPEPERRRPEGDGERVSREGAGSRESARSLSSRMSKKPLTILESLPVRGWLLSLGTGDDVIWMEGVLEACCGNDTGISGDESRRSRIWEISWSSASFSSACPIDRESDEADGV
jgi:hypothetical protein